MSTIPTITLPAGETVPALGQGTWQMGGSRAERDAEVRALRVGIELGMTLIDTAEMYASGGAEEVVAHAAEGQRDDLFIVSKVLPGNASRRGTIKACEQSLRRLRTDRIDLYLLHWPGHHPVADTVAAFEELRAAGKIRHWGVSNLDVAEMEELFGVAGGDDCQTNQVLYNLTRRGIEHDLMPWCAAHRMPIMAYSPIEQGRLAHNRALEAVAKKHGGTPAQVALRFSIDARTISIPKASSEAHVRDNRACLDLVLDEDDRAVLDAAFPPPAHKRPLEMI
jgi:diketogulonate reductase-like aldo/keto reductase